MRSLVLLLSMLSCPVIANAGDIHQWRDENGNVHFGDKPPASVETTQIVVKPNVYASPTIERNTTSLDSSQEAETPAGRINVIMYSAEWCGYCKKARKYFTANSVPFDEYDVEKSSKGKRDYKKLKAKGVPVILVGKKRMNGFSAVSFESIYNAAAPGA